MVKVVPEVVICYYDVMGVTLGFAVWGGLTGFCVGFMAGGPRVARGPAFGVIFFVIFVGSKLL